MVLVSYILDNYISVLQTKFSDREGHEARRIGLEAMPLDQCIEGGHGERESGLEIRPAPMHDLLEVHDEREHREYRLYQQAVLPLATLTQFEIARIALGGMKGGITQDNHLVFALANQPLKGIIRDIGGGTFPPHDHSPLIEEQTEFSANDPTVIGEAFPADLVRTPAFAHGVDELDAIRVDDAEHGRSGEEDLCPVLMGPEEAKKAGPLGEPGKQRPIVTCQPAIKRPVADAFERMQVRQVA